MSCCKSKSKYYKLLEEYILQNFDSDNTNTNINNLETILNNDINETNIN